MAVKSVFPTTVKQSQYKPLAYEYLFYMFYILCKKLQASSWYGREPGRGFQV